MFKQIEERYQAALSRVCDVPGLQREIDDINGQIRELSGFVPPTLWAKATVKERRGRDWTEVSCGGGQVAIGGGCQAFKRPHKFEYNGPSGRSAWKCGGFGGKKRVWAICVPDDGRVRVKEQRGGDWHQVNCDHGDVVTGGGCQAFKRPHKMEYNGPAGRSAWKCGGFGGKKRVWAICAPDDGTISIRENP